MIKNICVIVFSLFGLVSFIDANQNEVRFSDEERELLDSLTSLRTKNTDPLLATSINKNLAYECPCSGSGYDPDAWPLCERALAFLKKYDKQVKELREEFLNPVLGPLNEEGDKLSNDPDSLIKATRTWGGLFKVCVLGRYGRNKST